MNNCSYKNRSVVRFIIGDLKGYIGIITDCKKPSQEIPLYSGIVFKPCDNSPLSTIAQPFSNISQDTLFDFTVHATDLSAALGNLQKKKLLGRIISINSPPPRKTRYSGVITQIHTDNSYSGYFFRQQFFLRRIRINAQAIKVIHETFFVEKDVLEISRLSIF